MNKKQMPRGIIDYCSMPSGVLVTKWKDNKMKKTIVYSDARIESMSTVKRCDKTAKAKVNIQCPDVIKKCNGRMCSIEKASCLPIYTKHL